MLSSCDFLLASLLFIVVRDDPGKLTVQYLASNEAENQLVAKSLVDYFA